MRSPLQGSGSGTGTGVVDGKITLGTQDKIDVGIRGHHLTSEILGDTVTYMMPGQVVDDTGSSSMVECRQDAKEICIVTHGNGADAWVANKSVTTGDRIRPTDTKASGFIYIANNNGTTGATEPATWPTVVGSTVVDNAITWARNVVLDKSGLAKDGAYPEFVDKFDQEWVGTKYFYNVVPVQNFMLQKAYYRLGGTLTYHPGDGMRIQGYRGVIESGTKIFDTTLRFTSVLPAYTEVSFDLDNISYTEGEELHWVLELITDDVDAQFSLITNSGNAQPWRCVDRQKFQHVALVPADTAYPSLRITSPTQGASGVSLTPTIVTELGQSRRTSWHGAPNISVTTVEEVLTIAMPANILGANGKLTGTFYFNQAVASSSSPLVYVGLSTASGQVTAPQATGTKQPVVNDTDDIGIRSAVFDGVDDELRSSVALPLGTRYAMFVAFRQNASGIQVPIVTDEYNPDSNINYAIGHSTSTAEYTGTVNTFGGGHFNGAWRKTTGLAYALGTFGFAALRYDGANMRLKLNGGTEQLTAQTSNPGTSTTVMHIGSNYYTTATAYTNCRMFRILGFSSSISDADVERIEGWIAWKYGQLALLPAGHPYKTNPIFRNWYTDKFVSVS